MMKPKIGENNAEMDEPMKNPLQLVKELVLLIVEARTPDLSVKGRAEGPHCPVIRGRPAHKCSAEKSECVRASEFCSLAHRLWLNSIPIYLDILLFPDCIHGQEEVFVTEGTITKLSHENALLIERWTIDGNKRRQDDCLSSPMLIQAVRSYLHFSQISSWLYSTSGKLPGLLAYRVYAPGELTSLDFAQAPDIHSFPVCLASFHHVRVRVSSLQRQASVPILVCLQDQAMRISSMEALCRNDNLQKHKSRDVEVITEHEQLYDFTSSKKSFKGNSNVSEMTKKAHPSTASYNTLTKKLKSSKKSLKSLQEVSALVQSEKKIYQNCPLVACAKLLPSSTFSRTDNTYEGTINKQTLPDTGILARKARNQTRMMTTDGKDVSNRFSDVLYVTSVHKEGDLTDEDADCETFLDIHTNPTSDAGIFIPDLPERRIKSSDLRMRQSILNQMDDNIIRWDNISGDIKRNVRGMQKYEENSFCIEQIKTGLNMETQDRKPVKLLEDVDEHRQTDKEVDLQTLIRKKKKAEYSKFKKSLIEGQPDMKANLEMWWPLQVQRMRMFPQNVFESNVIYSSDRRKLPFSLSPKEKFHNGCPKDVSAFNINSSIETKMLARKNNRLSQKEVNEEEFIRILSDRLSVVNSHPEEIFPSPKFSDKFNNTEHFIDSNYIRKNLPQKKVKSHPPKKWHHSKMIQDDSETVGLDDIRDKVTAKFGDCYLAQNSNLSELTISVTKSPEDSDDTPVASPNQKIQLKQVSESLIKSVADKSVQQSCQWLQQNQSKSLHHESPLVLAASSNISESELTADRGFTFIAREIFQGHEFDDTALNKTMSDRKQIIDRITEAQTVTKPDLQVQLGETDVDKCDQLLCRTKLENNYTPFLNNETCLNRNGHVSEDPLVENCHSNYYPIVTQPGCRRVFEENLLPLVSYDADSDSFKKVEELYSPNILHSPKVLFSCDVPSTKVTSSRKCINFGDIFEAEFFKAKLSDMVDPEAIGKYMSNLAILSSSFTNGQEDQDIDTFVHTVNQVEDLNEHDEPSNFIEMSSRTKYLLQAKKEVKDLQESSYTPHVHPVQDYRLTETENDNEDIIKGKQNKGIQGGSNVNVDDLDDYNLTKDSVTWGRINKARRQLNLNNFENTQPPMKTKEQKSMTAMAANVSLSAIPANVSLSAIPDGKTYKHNAQIEEQNEKRTYCRIITSEEISASFPSKAIVTLSPLLSSSCSSSSSTSSASKVSSYLSPTFPTALRSPAYKQETYKIENGSEEDSCVLDIKEPLSIYSSNVTSKRNSPEQEDGGTRTFPVGGTSIQRNLQTYLKSNWRSSNNKESLTFSNATFSVPSTPQSPTSSLQSTSVSAHQHSAVLLSLQVSQEAAPFNLCRNDKNSPTSLSMVIITQPSPHDDSDLDNKSFINFEPEHKFSFGFQHNVADLCDQNVLLHNDLDSQKDCDAESVHCGPKLCQDPPEVQHLIDGEPTSYDQDDTKGNVSAISRTVQEADSHREMFKCAQTSLDILSMAEKDITKSTQENLFSSSAFAKPPFDSLQNQIQPSTIDVGTCDNHSQFSIKELNFGDSPTASNSFNSVTSSQTDITETSHIVSAGNNYSSKNEDTFGQSSSVCKPKDGSEFSCNMRVMTEPMRKVSLHYKNNIASQTVNPLAKAYDCDDSPFLQKHSDFFLEIKDNCSSLRDLNFRSKSQTEEEFGQIFSTSSLGQPTNSPSEDFGIDKNSEMYFGGAHYTNTQIESMHQHHPSTKIIQNRQHSKNGFEMQCLHTADEMDDETSDWKNDVVFYLSESESKVKADMHMSLLSHSLIENVSPSQNYKATRPSSLSAEVNLEMRLRSNLGVGKKSNLDFSSHSRSPPFHSDPLGWSSVPPHRTVSTPSCMDREASSNDENSISNISVIQQQNCDNVSHTGLRRMAAKSASMIFNNRTGLPTQSSPAPLKRKSGGKFDYDVSLLNTRAIKNAFSCSKLASNVDGDNEEEKRRTLSTSAPASTNCLLGNFEESILNGRIDPVGTVDGFTSETGASGSFCPKHLHLPVSAFFFALSDDNAPSPYLGHINLESVGKKGYHIPKKGTVQVTLFNPSKTVVKMFVVVYDLSDMPASSQTFIRQRTVYCPIDKNHTAPSYLRYLIHLRCASSQSGKIYLHTDIRLIFARHKLDIDAKTIPYELKSYTEGPHNPKYSPKK